MKHASRLTLAGALLACLMAWSPAPVTYAEDAPGEQAEKPTGEETPAQRGLSRLTKTQASSGSWNGTYSFAIASFAALAYLAAADEPYEGAHANALHKTLNFLIAQQKDGVWPNQGHTWIHGQGFATLALSEAYGRSLLCKTKPHLDMRDVRKVIERAVVSIQENQSASGGWWYTQGDARRHEGSTTCCAVQALVSASNFGIPIDKAVLERGFEYLKQCQNADGGFDYKLGDPTSMKEGTAGGVATLGLMRKFDYTVMMKGYEFLLKLGPAAISKERFPYYGHFYGLMGMRLLGQEFEPFRDKIDGYADGALKDLAGWQRKDGSWPTRGWILSQSEPDAYATGFATLIFSIRDGRLSIFDRAKPKLPAARPKPKATKGH